MRFKILKKFLTSKHLHYIIYYKINVENHSFNIYFRIILGYILVIKYLKFYSINII